MEEAKPDTFSRAHPGLFVVQTSLTISSIIIIALSLSVPQEGQRCVFGVSDEDPQGNAGVCAFTSIVSFVSLFFALAIFIYARWKAPSHDSWWLEEEEFFRFYVISFLMGCLWFLDGCLVAGYFDLTCSNVSRCRDLSGWNVGGWVVTGSWVHVALWFFAFFVYLQLSRKVGTRNNYKYADNALPADDATWTVSATEIVKSPPGHPDTEIITLKCADPNEFTIVITSIHDDGRANDLPRCQRITVNGHEQDQRHYMKIVNALAKAIVPHEEDNFAKDRAIQILLASDGPFLANAGLPYPGQADRDHAEMERLRQQQLERKHSVGGGLSEAERLRQRLVESERANSQLARELEERKQYERTQAESATGRARAQSEQEREASRLLQQMVELEAQQQKQHADQIAALERQIASLKRAGGGGASPAGKQVWEGD